ncbi:hypothetical protein [Rhodococcus sp. AD45]|uniref:carboxymuconolactone decarboxylase family protein n=1 Tax=Rhodococcus sp. (strain AD45) TaxID=103808 RepID=UPI0005DF3C66|nr:hypothetical protein [Rhodococcus sp. AD45]KJF19424.1 hypothetical protein SZ00_06351 [Rhodococcus sp. AD45]
MVQLLCIAIDASCTHLYAPGIRRHIRVALDLGVTEQEILEVLKIATTVGIHSSNVGLPILREEAAAARSVDPVKNPSGRRVGGSDDDCGAV